MALGFRAAGFRAGFSASAFCSGSAFFAASAFFSGSAFFAGSAFFSGSAFCSGSAFFAEVLPVPVFRAAGFFRVSGFCAAGCCGVEIAGQHEDRHKSDGGAAEHDLLLNFSLFEHAPSPFRLPAVISTRHYTPEKRKAHP